MSAPSSQASADSTSDLPELGFDTPSSVSRMLGGEPSLPTTGPESRSTRTYALSENQRGELLLTDVAHQLTSGGGKPGQGYPCVFTHSGGETYKEDTTVGALTQQSASETSAMTPLISYAEAFLAKTSPSPADAPDSQELAAASFTSSPASLSLFDLDGFSSRTYPDCSPRTAVGTSESCLERWPTSGTAWAGGLSTAVSSECRSDEGGCSSSEPSLTEILEPPQNVPAKYSLSARAAQGILRRAGKRGKALPIHLSTALKTLASSEASLEATQRESGANT